MTDTRISAGFRRRITDVWGDDGARWLAALPALLRESGERWRLTLGPPFPLSNNYVAPATRADGTEVVLKAGVPRGYLRAEIAALRHFGGSGAVRLLAADADAGVMLLERIRPGSTLAEVGDDDVSTAIAAGVMRALWRPPPALHSFPTVENLGRRFRDETRSSGPLPADLFTSAAEKFEALATTSAVPVVLHGDLHHENMLRSKERGWLAIDPEGMIGEPAYETGALLRNPLPGIADAPNLTRVLARRIDVLHRELGFDARRIAGWGMAQAVLSALWTIDDHGDGWQPAATVAAALAALCD